MPRNARLRQSDEFKRVFTKAYKSADGYFTVLARTSSERRPARLGLAIAKKCAHRAVDRNHLKRVARESFRHERATLIGVDCIVLCRPGAVRADNRCLYDSLARHWSRIRDRLCERF